MQLMSLFEDARSVAELKSCYRKLEARLKEATTKHDDITVEAVSKLVKEVGIELAGRNKPVAAKV